VGHRRRHPDHRAGRQLAVVFGRALGAALGDEVLAVTLSFATAAVLASLAV